jgi:hypothetical protein
MNIVFLLNRRRGVAGEALTAAGSDAVTPARAVPLVSRLLLPLGIDLARPEAPVRRRAPLPLPDIMRPFARVALPDTKTRGEHKLRASQQSRRWDSNPRPAVYETAALPLSYVGDRHIIRTATPTCQADSLLCVGRAGGDTRVVLVLKYLCRCSTNVVLKGHAWLGHIVLECGKRDEAGARPAPTCRMGKDLAGDPFSSLSPSLPR